MWVTSETVLVGMNVLGAAVGHGMLGRRGIARAGAARPGHVFHIEIIAERVDELERHLGWSVRRKRGGVEEVAARGKEASGGDFWGGGAGWMLPALRLGSDAAASCWCGWCLTAEITYVRAGAAGGVRCTFLPVSALHGAAVSCPRRKPGSDAGSALPARDA